jgi:hypothetical protein
MGRFRGVGAVTAGVVLVLVPAALAVTSLERFVARAGEEKGFVPHGQPQIFSTARGWVAVEPARQARRDAARLRREGFVLGIFQGMTSTHDPKNRAGASSVLELGSSTAARAEQRVEMREGIAALNPKDMIRRYTIPGVPGALGYTATLAGRGAANAFFTEGRCLLLLADNVPLGNVAGPVEMAARAIFSRTGGRCP